ncbi:unnamed protein product [Pocillopora meandrina]|uniref:Uncharacterized protein n=1 Tax=Pocillopora meandrina TaxID=46732 RepID=A0AAU9VX26_9CNID|nr:unnamed protein product [Pocillopora meandrina]
MEKLLTASRELIAKARLWSVERKNTVRILRELADDILKHHFNVNVAKIAGSSSAIGGFALVATGFALAPFTFGSSVILSAVGGALCAGGGATAAGSGLVKRKIIQKKLAIAQEAMNADQRSLEPVQKLLGDLDREVSNMSFGVLKDRLSFSGSVVMLIKNLVDLGKSAKAGARVATIAAGEGVEAVFRAIGIGANAARIGLFAVSAIFFPFDIYTLVDSSIQIDNARKEKRESEPEVVKMLKGLAEALEKEMDEILRTVNDFEESLDNLVF